MEKQKLPNATAVLVLGILSILTCCCYGVLGLIFGIIAIVLAKKDKALYMENPELYSNYSNLNTGRILAIIGICLSAVYLLVNVYLLAVVGQEGITEMQQEWIRQLQNK
ncbi:MAG: CCC motif membrane protein [Flavobacterium sp.]|nr:CCC motif membrane protein [Flavobacterium sp.]